MNAFALDVMDFHELPTWKEARMLALKLHRSSSNFPDKERSEELRRRIQESCVSLLTTLVTAFDSRTTGVDAVAQRKAEESVEQLEQLVRQADSDGLLTPAEFHQLNMEFEAVRKSFHA